MQDSLHTKVRIRRGKKKRRRKRYARSEYHTQLAKMSFDEIFDLTAGVYYFHFL